VNLNSLLAFNVPPASLELFLHLAPHGSRLVIELHHFYLGGLFELVKSELALDDSCFLH